MRATLLALLVVMPVSSALVAQSRSAADGALTASLGQPEFWKWSAGAALGAARRDGEGQRTTELRGALSRDVWNPVIGLAGIQFESFAGTRNAAFDGGMRARLTFPFFRVGVGADFNVVDSRTRLMLSLTRPARRGGLFRDGSMLRLDVTPGRNWSVAMGMEKPILRRIPPGRTRPPLDYARLSSAPLSTPRAPLLAAVADPLAVARAAAAWIGAFTVPWLEHQGSDRLRAESLVVARIEGWRASLSADDADGNRRARLMDDEVRHFHSAVEHAFLLAVNGGVPGGDSLLASRVAGTARSLLMDEVLLPYNRLLGQEKRDDTTLEFAQRARGMFLRWLHTESAVPRASIDDVIGVFTAVVAMVEENRAAIRAACRDSRFVWLPMQYALLPEEHDTQSELDALIERAVGGPFLDGNFISYVINEQFQFQLSRTIREARDYHVLWIHDFRGVDSKGDPDELSYRHLTQSYLRALTQRVREYDSTGTLPSYVILLDEFFYRVRRTRMWMDLLEEPLQRRLQLPRGYEAWEDSLAAAQDSLRAAVAGSRLLQAQRAQNGDAWLRNLVKVHVNITNAADHTFWSRHVVRFLSVPDNVNRDHRKLVFHDISEADPYRGEAMYTGAGVGEHYANLSWEDRSVLLRGPAALQLKSAARDLLLAQGMEPSRIPWHLQARERAPDYDARVQAAINDGGRQALRALGVHNQTGYGDKDVNVTKAVLYTLMPPGSVIKIPDSIWNSAFWGSALIGSALRGVRVLVIAPALPNAPAPAFGSMALAYELLWRQLAVSQHLAPELAERGGMLRVGMYNSTLRVNDIPGKVLSVERTFEKHEWLRALFGFPPAVYEGLAEIGATYAGLAMDPDSTRQEYEFSVIPKLHLKSNIFASREAWQFMSRPEWVEMTIEVVNQRIAQVQQRRRMLDTFEDFPDARLTVGDGTVRRWLDSLPKAQRERVVFYSVMGSQNQNTRSMVADGEDALVISGWPAIVPYVDLISVIGQSEWLDDPADLQRLLPPKSAFLRRVSHWLRYAF